MNERTSTGGAWAASALVLVLYLPCVACSGEDAVDAAKSPTTSVSGAPSAALGDGVALEVGGVPLLASEIEAHADTLALVYPEQTRPALLRRAIVDICLPRIALGVVHRTERERALAAAHNEIEALRAGKSQNLPSTLVLPFADLDVSLQTALRDAPAGAIVGPIESNLGTFNVAVVKTPFIASAGPLQEVVVDGWSFPYLDPTDEASVVAGQAALEGLGARFASDAWRDLVPLTVQSRLGVKQ